MRCPDFFAGPASANSSSHRDEDIRFLRILKDVWARAGYEIKAEVVEVGMARTNKTENAIYGIRSNLVNGLPSGKPKLVRP